MDLQSGNILPPKILICQKQVVKRKYLSFFFFLFQADSPVSQWWIWFLQSSATCTSQCWGLLKEMVPNSPSVELAYSKRNPPVTEGFVLLVQEPVSKLPQELWEQLGKMMVTSATSHDVPVVYLLVSEQHVGLQEPTGIHFQILGVAAVHSSCSSFIFSFQTSFFSL